MNLLQRLGTVVNLDKNTVLPSNKCKYLCFYLNIVKVILELKEEEENFCTIRKLLAF